VTATLSLPSILQNSLFLDLFEGDIITGSSLAVLRFFMGFKGSASTRIFTDFMSATKVFAASLDPEAGMNQ
jgi:hypothetical protein